MIGFIDQLPEIINKVFNVLDLLVIRLAIFGLAAMGAHTLFANHFRIPK